MTMEKALFQLIADIPGIDLGTNAPDDLTRIYASLAPQGTTDPFVVYQRVEATRWRSLDGPSGIVQATMQIDCYAQSYFAAKDLALLIEKTLDGYAGTVAYGGDSPQAFVKFAGITLQNDLDIFDQTDEPFLHRVSCDYLVTYEQT